MNCLSLQSFIWIPSTSKYEKHSNHQKKFQIAVSKRDTDAEFSLSFSCLPSFNAIHKTVPLAASIAILLWSPPAHAGFMSGMTGIESVPGPQLPQIDFLTRLNEENQKKYAENDARFKSSPLLKKLLEQSKLNKEKNRREIENKYCIRGAEWGVGDCSAEGLTPEERENFIAMLKQNAAELEK
ncbi:hypothetical protein HN51_007877 [Arachis hypogaea]|uniref:Uncharacterized protein n=2 Tax=Arachis TaxID=3817 RepID=A0A445D6I3_ARAHY|nr:uncharacterized protein LOC107489284 [Arachis duranensis]XP_025700156.1 uncharacterized protein LOC112801560 [Arachis hypogaea]XP_057762502.1 uncharacterized protein LOC130982495 [Arachis stenosperma]QHO42111.1 uncharacterized protein DS421_5g151430 [Arachis hypogaea]RYR58604.1 hypothetical protein Ahy_A05g024462 [Arachis hypogaea]